VGTKCLTKIRATRRGPDTLHEKLTAGLSGLMTQFEIITSTVSLSTGGTSILPGETPRSYNFRLTPLAPPSSPLQVSCQLNYQYFSLPRGKQKGIKSRLPILNQNDISERRRLRPTAHHQAIRSSVHSQRLVWNTPSFLRLAGVSADGTTSEQRWSARRQASSLPSRAPVSFLYNNNFSVFTSWFYFHSLLRMSGN
jgi:hypothetical protein